MADGILTSHIGDHGWTSIWQTFAPFTGRICQRRKEREPQKALLHLKSLPIFIPFLILQHTQIRLVTRVRNLAVCHRLEDGAPRLVGMGAVGEATILGESEDLSKVTSDLLGLHIKGAKALYARRIYHIAPLGHAQHLAKGGGVHARIMCPRDLLSL